VLLVVTMLMRTTGQEDKARASETGAAAITRGGPLTAFQAVLLYAAIITLILWLNVGRDG
jgi:hypothetical protein